MTADLDALAERLNRIAVSLRYWNNRADAVTAAADALRAAMGASPEPSEDWTAVLHELADLPCAEPEASGRAPGDETCSCYLECVGCRARRAVERLALREPSDEAVARELATAYHHAKWEDLECLQQQDLRGMAVIFRRAVDAARERARKL